MNENDLKDKINEYRNEIEKKKKAINDILSEIKVHQKEIVSLRTARDLGNDECKRLSLQARELREKRDQLNMKIAALKEERRILNEQIKSRSGAIKDSKEKRDILNRSARGSDSTLVTRYERDMDALLNRDIPLDKEIKLFDNIFKLIDRVEAAREATEFHKKVISTYDEIKSLDDKADKISADIRALADESEKYHLKAVEIYAQVDELRKKADESHVKLLEKYNIVSPSRDKITALKKDMDKIQEEMNPYLGEQDKIRQTKEGERKAQLAVEAKQKLKSSKRISFDDFRALLEGEATQEEAENPPEEEPIELNQPAP
ncbi:MAG: hypothetical protein V1875_03245 [Candidatus Altiarchaeota archaeon]